jgi:hypothetical protein
VAHVRLDDERAAAQLAGHRGRVADDPGARRRDARVAQGARGQDLVLRGRARGVRVQDLRALAVQDAGQAERQLRVGLEDVEVVLGVEAVEQADLVLAIVASTSWPRRRRTS